MKRVLVLRPEPGASATARRARERGLEPVVVPLFQVEPVDWQMPDPEGFDGLLLTSANALRCAGEQLDRLRVLAVYAVGPATADAAREAGFDVRSTGAAGVEQLLASIESDKKLLHLGGEDRKVPADARQQITSVTVYRSRAKDDPDLGGATGSVAMIHSPGAGRRFAQLVNRNRSSVAIAAISAEAKEAVGNGWAAIGISEKPTDEALLALTERLCNNMPAT